MLFALVPTVDAVDKPFDEGWLVTSEGRWAAIMGVKLDLGGCGRSGCCCCEGIGPKLGDTD